MFWPKLVFLAGVGSFRRVSVRCFDEFGGVFGVRGGRVDCGDGRVSLQGRVGRGEVLHDHNINHHNIKVSACSTVHFSAS